METFPQLKYLVSTPPFIQLITENEITQDINKKYHGKQI